jgi:hypothetical protein
MFLNGGMLVHNLSVAAVEPPLPQFKPSQMLSMKIYICTPQRSTIGGLLLEKHHPSCTYFLEKGGGTC